MQLRSRHGGLRHRASNDKNCGRADASCSKRGHRPNMGISRQFRRLSRVLASKSDFLSFLRNRPPTREFSFLYPAHPAKPPSCTTILVAESQDLKPQMQTVLSGRAGMATPIFTTFFETSLVVTRALQKEVGG